MGSVDVVVPCYRYGRFLRQCVQSVLDQSPVEVRVLILDDASPDDTAEVAARLAQEDSRVTFVRHETNKGHTATFNEGIEWASAEYMLLLSADDYLLPGSLQRAVDLLDAHPEVGFVFGKVIGLLEDGTEVHMGALGETAGRSVSGVLTGPEFIELTGATCIVPTASAVVRTSVQKRIGGYRVELPHAGDMEMWLRFAAHGSVGVLDTLQAVYRKHGNNMSYTYFQRGWMPDLQQRKLVIDCFVETCGHLLENPDATRRRLLRELSDTAVAFASRAFNEGEMELSDELENMAIELYPGAKTRLPRIKLSLKRYMGLNRWRAVQPAIVKVRQLAANYAPGAAKR